MAKSNAGNSVGRPTIVDDQTVAILIASFQNGLNISQACLQAGISRDAYYDRYKADQDFATKMDKAQEFVGMKARQNITKSIDDGSVYDSWRYLERKDPEFKPKSDMTTDGKELPTPILRLDVQRNDSNSEDTPA